VQDLHKGVDRAREAEVVEVEGPGCRSLPDGALGVGEQVE
jgi:hypothetical protein